MIGVQGIGGVPEPANSNRADAGAKSSSVRRTSMFSRDEVKLSEEALAASRLTELVEQAEERNAEVRTERVAELQSKLEQGSHQVNEVVRFVAARVSSVVASQP
jgi:anti-sigma28 factor (negative regulator of flagellin synthesis)